MAIEIAIDKEELRELNSQLYTAHIAVVDLIPDDLQPCVQGIWSVRTSAGVTDWWYGFVDQVLTYACEYLVYRVLTDRLPCPLCGATQTGDRNGYTLRGLRWHLLGANRVRQCNAMAALKNFAERLARGLY